MKKKMVYALLIVTMSSPFALAQSGDWQAVMNLQDGTPISVESGHMTRCDFERATDKQLFCEHVSYWVGPLGIEMAGHDQVTFERAQIRRVRLELSSGGNAAVGSLIGAGAGIGICVGGQGQCGKAAVIFGGLGALVGGQFFKHSPIAHRRVIYRR